MDTHFRPTRPAHRGLILTLALAALALVGCSSSGQSSPSAGAGGAADFAASEANTGRLAAPAASVPKDVQPRAVISTGRMVLTSGDVGAARSDVDGVLALVGGEVSDENTITDRHGTVTSSHLVVRVPGSRFDEAMRRLEDVATLRSSTRKAEDVTTQVIDLGARIAAQQAGVHRLRQLVAQTGDLRALLAVERELSARQGELQSLRQQRAYLHDQTSMATITVAITRRTAAPVETAATGGFVGGLRHGWHALVATGTGVLLAVGLVLPFAVVALLIGIPAWIVVRRVRRPRTEPEAPAEA
jgi:hypothetical protein